MRLKRIAVLVSGGGSNLQCIIDAVAARRINAEICAVISDREGVYALERAQNAAIAAKCLPKAELQEGFNAALERELGRLEPDIVVLAGYLSILDAALVRKYAGKIINVHPSLIPAFCGMGMYGARVHQAVLDYGCKLSGATVHFVDEGADTGPIILQASVPVLEDDDAASLASRVLEVEHKLLPLAVELLVSGRVSLHGRKVKLSGNV